MIVAVHALIGAALGRYCRTPGQAALVGFASHLVADLIPHRDLEVPKEAVLVALALGLVGATQGFGSREFAGAVGATAPDAENGVAWALDLPDEKLLLPTHRCCHGAKRDSVAPQVVLALTCLSLLALPARDGAP